MADSRQVDVTLEVTQVPGSGPDPALPVTGWTSGDVGSAAVVLILLAALATRVRRRLVPPHGG